MIPEITRSIKKIASQEYPNDEKAISYFKEQCFNFFIESFKSQSFLENTITREFVIIPICISIIAVFSPILIAEKSKSNTNQIFNEPWFIEILKIPNYIEKTESKESLPGLQIKHCVNILIKYVLLYEGNEKYYTINTTITPAYWKLTSFLESNATKMDVLDQLKTEEVVQVFSNSLETKEIEKVFFKSDESYTIVFIISKDIANVFFLAESETLEVGYVSSIQKNGFWGSSEKLSQLIESLNKSLDSTAFNFHRELNSIRKSISSIEQNVVSNLMKGESVAEEIQKRQTIIINKTEEIERLSDKGRIHFQSEIDDLKQQIKYQQTQIQSLEVLENRTSTHGQKIANLENKLTNIGFSITASSLNNKDLKTAFESHASAANQKIADLENRFIKSSSSNMKIENLEKSVSNLYASELGFVQQFQDIADKQRNSQIEITTRLTNIVNETHETINSMGADVDLKIKVMESDNLEINRQLFDEKENILELKKKFNNHVGMIYSELLDVRTTIKERFEKSQTLIKKAADEFKQNRDIIENVRKEEAKLSSNISQMTIYLQNVEHRALDSIKKTEIYVKEQLESQEKDFKMNINEVEKKILKLSGLKQQFNEKIQEINRNIKEIRTQVSLLKADVQEKFKAMLSLNRDNERVQRREKEALTKLIDKNRIKTDVNKQNTTRNTNNIRTLNRKINEDERLLMQVKNDIQELEEKRKADILKNKFDTDLSFRYRVISNNNNFQKYFDMREKQKEEAEKTEKEFLY